jgi:GTPase Era involved in 16S rRNA processing
LIREQILLLTREEVPDSCSKSRSITVQEEAKITRILATSHHQA